MPDNLEIAEENARMDALMDLYPEAAFGGDGPWNNYGGDGPGEKFVPLAKVEVVEDEDPDAIPF